MPKRPCTNCEQLESEHVPLERGLVCLFSPTTFVEMNLSEWYAWLDDSWPGVMGRPGRRASLMTNVQPPPKGTK